MAKLIALALILVVAMIFCIEALLLYAVANNPRDKRSSMCAAVILGVLAAIAALALHFSTGGQP